MRRAIGILILTGLLLVLPLPGPAAAGASQPTGATASAATLRADFNGDGAADLAIGVPGENNFSGVVQVLYGASPGGLTGTGTQLWSQNSPGIASAPERNDQFGGVLAAGDFNGDAAADLAIGVPGENNFSGVVHVLHGSSPGGLTGIGSQLWSQNSPGIASAPEPGDQFGSVLAAGDFNGDGAADLAVGVPGENNFAGVVQVLSGASPGGLTGIGSQLWSQNSPGIASAPERDDIFGGALAAGDFNGDAAADLAVGVPGENNFAGVVQV
ncbi:MAG: FG-GAP repeat protein, partial [Acidimicrobiia bacterium]